MSAVDHDVIVVGLGGTGSAAAYQLAARGVKVLGLERFDPVHDRGASHGGSRLLRQTCFEHPAAVPLLLRARELWDQLDRDASGDLVFRTGGLWLGRPNSPMIEESLRAAREWGISHEVLTATDVRRRFPTFAPVVNEVALFEPDAGFASPERTVWVQLMLAGRAGADLRFRQPVLEWEALPGGTGVRVRTAGEEHFAERLVLCTGAWTPQLVDGWDLRSQRQVHYWFQPGGDSRAFLAHRHPVYFWEDVDGVRLHGFPAGMDTGVGVSFSRELANMNRAGGSWSEVRAIQNYLRTRLPALPGWFLRSATCVGATGSQPVLASHPENPQVTVACGFSGHGFTFVPVAGEIVAELALDGASRHPAAELFARSHVPAAATL